MSTSDLMRMHAKQLQMNQSITGYYEKQRIMTVTDTPTRAQICAICRYRARCGYEGERELCQARERDVVKGENDGTEIR